MTQESIDLLSAENIKAIGTATAVIITALGTFAAAVMGARKQKAKAVSAPMTIEHMILQKLEKMHEDFDAKVNALENRQIKIDDHVKQINIRTENIAAAVAVAVELLRGLR